MRDRSEAGKAHHRPPHKLFADKKFISAFKKFKSQFMLPATLIAPVQ
jgi:hypothetical protein